METFDKVYDFFLVFGIYCAFGAGFVILFAIVDFAVKGIFRK